MAERIYPSAKSGAAANPPFPATKAQLYTASLPAYRPQPKRRSHRRGCCCRCCLWFTFFLVVVILLAAIAAAVIYALYTPRRPSFAVESFRVSSLNVSSSSRLTSKFNLTVATRNPNKELVFFYDPVAISVTSGDVDVGDGSIPAFVHGKKNTTTLRAVIASGGQELDDASAARLRAALKSKTGLPLKITLETKVKAKMGALKTPKLRIRATCDGIRATAPSGKKPTLASISAAKCKVRVRIKIWRWTF